ncbi:helix-turn-helix domain-containing protein [Paucibacter sp. PLA-PC-4]|uniref:helix-turn-helix domain-containing protein n=1 Tax=Paucibacter sp. PLA-PC-4 TaxID=2993655 RepID=UPI00224982DE|nr:helix-turn-helix domain-containing protein [Paucibacter sp. PLA-PC-4]MCX2862083.1 helix-turn-helix domain-containing protein [Paucibacter sp. PLA-PC-4]
MSMILREGLSITQPLRAVVEKLWVSDGPVEPVVSREYTLPTGAMSLVLRLSGPPLRVFDSAETGSAARELGLCIVGGARERFYVRAGATAGRAVGAQLRPGASLWLLGVPALVLAHRHTPLGQLWGSTAEELRQRLAAEVSPLRALDLFEAALLERLTTPQPALPAVLAFALAAFARGCRVDAVVQASGFSHRHFNALFGAAVGLRPKAFCRVQRLQTLLTAMAAGPARPLAELALDAGYSDQAHMSREYSDIAGLTPGAYRRIAPAQINHVPVPPPQA